jgi:RNA polymerase sigma factor (sigma-70 family)
MKPNKQPTHEDWERFLKWLDPDRSSAAQRYEEIRAALVAYFRTERWPCAEDMADVVIERVICRGPKLFDSYVGDPKNYFKSCARNLHLDYVRRSPRQPGDQFHEEVERPATFEEEKAMEERRYACLEECMRRLTKGNRKLAIAYHEKEKGARIEHHKELAESFGITINALRLRMFRIHATLRECVTKCMDSDFHHDGSPPLRSHSEGVDNWEG